MVHFYPKAKNFMYIEDDSSFMSNVTSDDMKDVDRAYSSAIQAFNKKLQNRTEYKDSGVREGPYGTNLPTGNNGVVLFGCFISRLMNAPVGDKLFFNWLASDPMITAVGGENPDVFSRVFRTAEDVQKALDVHSKLLRVKDKMDGLIEVSNTKDLSDIKSLLSDLPLLKLNSDCVRFKGYLWSTLINFATMFSMVFTTKRKSIQFMKLSSSSLIEPMSDRAKLGAAFKNWYNTKVSLDHAKALRDLIHVEWKDLRAEGGSFTLPVSIYDGILEYATKGLIGMSNEHARFHTLVNSFISELDRMYQILSVGTYKRDTVSLPSLYFFGGKGVDTVVYNKISAEDEVSVFKSKYQSIIPLYEAFINQFYSVGPDNWLPGTSVRKAQIDGIPAYYCFDFYEPYQNNYRAYKVAFEMEKLIKAEPVVEFRPKLAPSTIFNDERKLKSYCVAQNGETFYGIQDMSPEVRAMWCDYLHDFTVRELDLTKNLFTIKEHTTGFTVLPPHNVIRALDVYEKGALRCCEGVDYTLKQINLDATASCLDLFFVFHRYELDDISRLGELYESRLAKLGTPQMIGYDVDFVDMKWDRAQIPNMSLMLSLSGSDSKDIFWNSQNTQLLPFGIENETMKGVNPAKCTGYTMPRYIKVDFPISAASLDVRRADLSGRDVIYTSPFKTEQGDPLLTVTKKPFHDKMLASFYKATAILDLSKNVVFSNGRVVRDTDGKVLFDFKVPLPGLENLDPTRDESFVITCSPGSKSKPCVMDFFEVDATTVNDAQLLIRVVESAITGTLLGHYTGRESVVIAVLNACKEYIKENFASDAFVSDVLQNCPVRWSSASAALESCITSKLDAAKLIAAYKTIMLVDFAADPVGGFRMPIEMPRDVKRALGEKRRGVIRYTNGSRFVSSVTFPPLAAISTDPNGCLTLICAFLERQMRSHITWDGVVSDSTETATKPVV